MLLGGLGLVAAAGRRESGGVNVLGELPHNLRLEPCLEPRGAGMALLGAPEGPIHLTRLAKGGFAEAYRAGDRVFVVVPEYVRDKDAAADAYAAVGAKNPHLPAVRRFGRMADGKRVYVMPYYEVPATRRYERAWEDQVVFDECDKEAFAAECRGEFRGLDPIFARQDYILSCADQGGVASEAVDALQELLAAGAKYSDEWGFDPVPSNFGVDAEGRLVLLDVLWDGKAARKYAELSGDW